VELCQTCGRPLDQHNKHIRFRLPDTVFAMNDGRERDEKWMSDTDANVAVMMQVPDAGGFVRCLLPVRLIEGHTVTFGVWLDVHPDDLRHAFESRWAPTYPDLRLDGRLAKRSLAGTYSLRQPLLRSSIPTRRPMSG
jgi:hypothetical protein